MDVVHDTCTCAAFHKTVLRHPSKEIDDFDVLLFQIYYGICTPIHIQIKIDLTKLGLLQK